MPTLRPAIVLGASGSVGGALVAQLLAQGDFGPIVTLVRRPTPELAALAATAGKALRAWEVAAMAPEPLAEATAEAIGTLAGTWVAFSALGVGAGTAKLSLEQHRAIDVGLNEAFARGCRDTGRVAHLALLSAVGADPTAATTGSGAPGLARYARVKGEVEEAVRRGGPPVVSTFRPAMIVGSQHTPWLLERIVPALGWLTPGKYRALSVTQIARAMVATARNVPAASAVYHVPDMLALAR